MRLEKLYLTVDALLRLVDRSCILLLQTLILSVLRLLILGVHINDTEDMTKSHFYTLSNLSFKILEIRVLRVVRFDS